MDHGPATFSQLFKECVCRFKIKDFALIGGCWVISFSRSRFYYYEKRVSQDPDPVFSNRLERNFRMERPNDAWAGDITYLWDHEGWQSLAGSIVERAGLIKGVCGFEFALLGFNAVPLGRLSGLYPAPGLLDAVRHSGPYWRSTLADQYQCMDRTSSNWPAMPIISGGE